MTRHNEQSDQVEEQERRQESGIKLIDSLELPDRRTANSIRHPRAHRGKR